MRVEDAGPRRTRGLTGLLVLAVEDESLVAMQLEDILFDVGCEVVGLAMRFGAALDLARSLPRIDCAVLDVNIGGDKVYPVAEVLAGRGVPFVFATGYGRAGVEPAWQDRPIVQKPYTARELAEHLLLAIEPPPPAA